MKLETDGFKNHVFSFLNGFGLSGLVNDAAVVFLDRLRLEHNGNLFMCFKDADQAFDFYSFV